MVYAIQNKMIGFMSNPSQVLVTQIKDINRQQQKSGHR